jgi:hypothetical protein
LEEAFLETMVPKWNSCYNERFRYQDGKPYPDSPGQKEVYDCFGGRGRIDKRKRDHCNNLPFKGKSGKEPEMRAVLVLQTKDARGVLLGSKAKVVVCCCYNYDWYPTVRPPTTVQKNFCNMQGPVQFGRSCTSCKELKPEHADYMSKKYEGTDLNFFPQITAFFKNPFSLSPKHLRCMLTGGFLGNCPSPPKAQETPSRAQFQGAYGCPL